MLPMNRNRLPFLLTMVMILSMLDFSTGETSAGTSAVAATSMSMTVNSSMATSSSSMATSPSSMGTSPTTTTTTRSSTPTTQTTTSAAIPVTRCQSKQYLDSACVSLTIWSFLRRFNMARRVLRNHLSSSIGNNLQLPRTAQFVFLLLTWLIDGYSNKWMIDKRCTSLFIDAQKIQYTFRSANFGIYVTVYLHTDMINSQFISLYWARLTGHFHLDFAEHSNQQTQRRSEFSSELLDVGSIFRAK